MNKIDIENTLKDYHWMINSIKIMRQSLESAGEGLTAQYGIESTMPKAKGQTSDPVHREVVRRGRHWKKVKGYEEKIKVIQERVHLITNERETEVLHWILEGKSYRWIAAHMGLSHSHIKRIKESIVDQISQHVPDVPNVPDVTNYGCGKSAC
ncbi:DNA-binding response regulator [Siminovitchia terrae]|uniref:DNA-binding response regulator n=1 Tax=Siminovitchia terrae TaxID=1914933 RepID=A0A429X2J8_SIMTE|nr:LuxR C-terminal-related transcriptional regulator [Siminovitchia terrae]RST57667.1 DNA-binding response regulator [Siminovitchia terrae]